MRQEIRLLLQLLPHTIYVDYFCHILSHGRCAYDPTICRTSTACEKYTHSYKRMVSIEHPKKYIISSPPENTFSFSLFTFSGNHTQNSVSPHISCGLRTSNTTRDLGKWSIDPTADIYTPSQAHSVTTVISIWGECAERKTPSWSSCISTYAT